MSLSEYKLSFSVSPGTWEVKVSDTDGGEFTAFSFSYDSEKEELALTSEASFLWFNNLEEFSEFTEAMIVAAKTAFEQKQPKE
jgi:hypothetical protein